jgi:hypothetical protein
VGALQVFPAVPRKKRSHCRGVLRRSVARKGLLERQAKTHDSFSSFDLLVQRVENPLIGGNQRIGAVAVVSLD